MSGLASLFCKLSANSLGVPVPNIFKIISRAAFAEIAAEGRFKGAAIDFRDGFIHFSTAAQLQETARLHFAGQTDLIVFAVQPDVLGARLKWEASRGGQLFPHVYGVISANEILWAKALPWGGDVHEFPAEVFA
jgi:uncharacterized protein (DUF952 family)